MQNIQADTLEQYGYTKAVQLAKDTVVPIIEHGFGLKTGYFAVGVSSQKAIYLWNRTFQESDYMNTLIMDVCNTRYVIYKYEPGLDICSCQFTDGIQVLSEGSELPSSSSFNVVNQKEPTCPPQKLIRMLKRSALK